MNAAPSSVPSESRTMAGQCGGRTQVTQDRSDISLRNEVGASDSGLTAVPIRPEEMGRDGAQHSVRLGPGVCAQDDSNVHGRATRLFEMVGMSGSQQDSFKNISEATKSYMAQAAGSGGAHRPITNPLHAGAHCSLSLHRIKGWGSRNDPASGSGAGMADGDGQRKKGSGRPADGTILEGVPALFRISPEVEDELDAPDVARLARSGLRIYTVQSKPSSMALHQTARCGLHSSHVEEDLLPGALACRGAPIEDQEYLRACPARNARRLYRRERVGSVRLGRIHRQNVPEGVEPGMSLRLTIFKNSDLLAISNRYVSHIESISSKLQGESDHVKSETFPSPCLTLKTTAGVA